jgi:hypothetical protein
MTPAEFTDEISRLGKVYGQKHLPAERVSLIWARFQMLSRPLFHDVISRIIADWTQASPPNLSTMIEYAQPEFRKHSEINAPKKTFQESAKGKKRSPWPASIEAIMLQIEDGRYRKYPDKFQTSLRFTKLTEAQVGILWDAFFEKRWNDESVKEILKGRNDFAVISTISNVAEKNAPLLSAEWATSPIPPADDFPGPNDVA